MPLPSSTTDGEGLGSPDKVIREREFGRHLGAATTDLYSSIRRLIELGPANWRRQHLNQLVHDSHQLESYLDEFGARQNRTYHAYAELIAAIRGLGHAAYSVAHVRQRLESYHSQDWQPPDLARSVAERLTHATDRLHQWIVAMCQEAISQGCGLGIPTAPETDPSMVWLPLEVRRRLPRNLEQDEIEDEELRIADLASKFIQAADLLSFIGRIGDLDSADWGALMSRHCTEERARVYEATVHNLQSTYDTFVRNTVLEARDPGLRVLRGYASAALHCLEAVTGLVHFRERHSSESRSAFEQSARRLAQLVPSGDLEFVVVHDLLAAAAGLLSAGRDLAGGLLPKYSKVGELEVELLDGLAFHARPAALIFGIVQHHGLPVELELGGKTCNAGSILEMLLAVGSAPDERRFLFRGDERTLRDIQILFESGLGELSSLPDRLAYLRNPTGRT